MSAKWNPPNIDDLVQSYTNGRSVLALSGEYGVSRRTITKRLAELGIVVRTNSEAHIRRWQRSTPDQRLSQVRAAQNVRRGSHEEIEVLIARAATRERRCLGASTLEQALQALLQARGIDTITQQAIGPYNCDLGASPVAVEVWGGDWHWTGRAAQRFPERTRYLLNAGWHMLAVIVNKRFPLNEASADYISAYIEQARTEPTMRREYRVVRGAGEALAAGRADDNEITLIPTLTARRNATNGRYKTIAR